MVSKQAPRPSLRREVRQVAIVLGIILVLELIAWLPNVLLASG